MTLETYLERNKIPYKKNLNEIFIENSLQLIHESVESLPNGLHINGILQIIGTPISKIPDDIKIHSYIFFESERIKSFPEHLRDKVRIYTPYKGRWQVVLTSTKIRIGCVEQSVWDWEKFFRDKRHISTNPVLFPRPYKKIHEDFKEAQKLHEHYFGK